MRDILVRKCGNVIQSLCGVKLDHFYLGGGDGGGDGCGNDDGGGGEVIRSLYGVKLDHHYLESGNVSDDLRAKCSGFR